MASAWFSLWVRFAPRSFDRMVTRLERAAAERKPEASPVQLDAIAAARRMVDQRLGRRS